MHALNSNQIIAAGSLATLLLTAAAIFFSVRGLRHQLWLQTFGDYTRRYAALVHDLPVVARDPKLDLTLNDFNGEDQDRLVTFARGYFNLCSEEHFLHDKNRIDHDTWRIWCCGINDMLRLRWMQDLWRDLSHEYSGYQSFTRFLHERAVAAERAIDHRLTTTNIRDPYASSELGHDDTT